ncbi:helix-turn-helix transcriptional regulator [Nocardia aurantiaca]|uniref:Helix-turn-helix domain-containing protein n=1 Tax=Nocardia aurantiaca TaxID=2675850 RepID=A0A6I3L3X1_9NOCA|nr:helix-turn-helix domain-containing protein [Nocardia aurantiaca]MTE15196.1 helix-turn-helix domain-containing protein [Nocardia aurantiaca]
MTGPSAPANTTTPGAGGGRRSEVLAALRAAPVPLSILELADRLALHPNTVRFHLDALVSAGQAERVQLPRTGPGRPPQMFRAHSGMDPAGPRNYRLLADVLVTQLAADPDAAGRALEAGRAWGRRLAAPAGTAPPTARQAVEGLVHTLDELGFAPEADTDGSEIRLRHCPFLDMTTTRTAVVCPIHLGLMQGALAAQTAPITVDELEPFTEPGLCLAHISVTGPQAITHTPPGPAA